MPEILGELWEHWRTATSCKSFVVLHQNRPRIVYGIRYDAGVLLAYLSGLDAPVPLRPITKIYPMQGAIRELDDKF